jgi:serine/threonine-protein phosphatase 2A regulatory subunit A
MSEQLGNLIDHVGGEGFAYHLIAPLKRLAIVEDSAVRMKAIESLLKVAQCLPQNHMNEHWLPTIIELKSHDYVTARIAACSLCCAALGKYQQDVRLQV